MPRQRFSNLVNRGMGYVDTARDKLPPFLQHVSDFGQAPFDVPNLNVPKLDRMLNTTPFYGKGRLVSTIQDMFGDLAQSDGSLMGGLSYGGLGSGRGSLFGSMLSGGPNLGKFLEQSRQAKQVQSGFSGQSGQQGNFGSLPSGDGVLQWSNLMNTVGNEFGIPPDVLAAIMHIETGGTGNPSLQGPMTSFGYKAQGLMQVMPNWFQGIANKYGGDLLNPETNLRTAAEILRGHYQKFGDWEAVARAYFAGEGGMWDDQRTDGHGARVGTSVAQYAQAFNQHRNTYQGMLQQGQLPGAGNLTGFDAGSAWSVFGNDRFRISQPFGHTSFSQSSGWYGPAGHTGIDIAAPSGTRLFTPVNGEVTYSGIKGGYGGTVMIRTDFGYLMLTHMRALNVNVGDRVSAGTYLGESGGAAGEWGAGTSTGSHVHFEVRDRNGNPIDPRDIFSF